MAAEKLITDHLDLWTAAIKRKSTAGRGSSGKIELYGIKKLRELILELAVRGLLVPQDPNDEPSSELLKKIAAEKAKLAKAGKIKQGKALPPIAADSQKKPPLGWSWTCMAALGEIAPRNEVQDDVIASFIPMPLISTRFDGRHDHESKTWAEIKKGYTHFANGDVAIAKITPCFENSKAAIFSGLHNGVGAGTTELHVVRPFGEFVSKSYLLLYLKSPQFLRIGESKMTGSAGQKRVPTEFFSFNPLPLPPLAEQHRIVAKVDELMALCDQLEQQTDASLSAHQTLVETLLSALTSAADHAQFASTWQRIAEHFDILFTTEESIDQLKQTILQLAVMGKVVPQDPNDEPASELLKKIAAEKAKLVKEGKIKKEKPLPSVRREEQPFIEPSGWTWCRLQTAFDVRDGTHDSPKFLPNGIPFLTSKNIYGGRLDLSDVKFISQYDHIEFSKRSKVDREDILFAMIGSIGNPVVVDTDMEFSFKNMALFKFVSKALSSPKYLQIFLSVIADEMKDKAAGGVQSFVALGTIRNQPLALPPLAEQHRIVTKVDELMMLCDQLKSRLSATEQLRSKLVDAVIEASLNPPSGKIIPLPDAAAREARRHAVGCHVVETLKNQRTFGRTVLMKLIYLADTHVGAELAMEPKRAARGPFDSWIYDFEKHAKAAGWFNNEETQGERNKVRYLPQAGLAARAAKMHELLDATRAAELDRVLKIFADLSTEEAEIIATLFAAWNDFLIDGHTPDDAEVIREVRENWASEKLRFSVDALQTWLNWMRKKKLVPRGLGPRTVHQAQLFH